MSIIYSYPEQSILNAGDMLIGTSVEKVGGKQKNVTKNFTIQQVADFINRGAGFVDPVATDFQIPVFNQEGKKITGSIMSQDVFPNGSTITISGGLTATGAITTSGNLIGTGNVTLGSNENLISLNSKTRLNGPLLDTTGTIGSLNQILLSDSTGVVRWQDYEAGLTYEGTWDASNNTTNGQSNSPALLNGQGTSGHFYIVNVPGSVNLDGNNDWHVGDWAVFLDEGGQAASWQKIDNTSTLAGSGTAGTFARWTNATTLNDSIMSESGSVVTIGGSLKIQDTLEATTANTNLKLKGAGTGGVEIMSADGVTDGKIRLNCSQDSHGVTIQSPPHANNATYTLILPSSVGTVNQVLTSAGAGAGAQLTWSSPTVGTVTDFTAVSTAIPGITTTVTTSSTTPELTLSITGTPTASLFLDGTGNWSSPGGGVTDITATGPLNADVATGSVTLSMPAYATATGGYVPSGGGTGQYLDGLTGSWTALPVTGVTSVSGTLDRISVTGGNTAVVDAITGAVNSTSNNLATGAQIQTAIDTALAGAVTFKGTFNANTGAITGTSDFLYNPGANTNTITIAVGDMYIVTVAGNFYGNTALNVGDEVIAITAAAINSSLEAGWNAVASGAGGAVTGSGTTNYVPKFTGATVVGNSSIFNDASGNVGIGTTNPAQGNLVLSPSTQNATLDGLVLAYNPDGGANRVRAKLHIDNFNGILDLKSSGDILTTRINSAGDSYFNNGNVGIGTTSPGSKLDVSGVTDESIRLSTSYPSDRSARAGIKWHDATNETAGIWTEYDGVGNNVSINFGNLYNSGYQTNTSMIIRGNGKVGIGTDQPEVSLDLSANTDAILVPNGDTAARPSGILPGMIRYNTQTSEFEGYSGTLNVSGSWGALGGGGGASNIVSSNHASNGTVGPFSLGGTPSGNSTTFVDVFIDGVYQQVTTYSITGTSNDEITFANAVPSGVTIETKTTTGVNSGAAVTSVDLGQTTTTGAINLRIIPNYVTGNISAQANNLYIFDNTTTAYTLTLPSGPQAGDSIKISNRGGLATNILAVPATENIMGGTLGASMTINNVTAAFEIIYSGDSSKQGWVIIGNV